MSVVLVGCSSNSAAEQPASSPAPSHSPIIPTTVSGTVPVPPTTLPTSNPTDAAVPPVLPEQATAPPPANAGPLTAGNLPAPDKLGPGWKTYADPGGAEAGFIGNNTWTRRRDPHQASYEALPSGCAGQPVNGSLPVPAYALTGSYRTAEALPATALLLRFSNSDRAAAYYAGYQARMKACGSGGDLSVKQLWAETAAATAVRTYAGAESYVDVSVVKGATVALLATTSSKPEQQADWARTVVPALEAGMG
ncbi:hypothetical protein [Kribbella speibonae]|uniref:PknH-like extracellular domain-containing protein n=1 Tax=Kribbella speibonae TaxID=1572660 RepID=A0A4R0IWW1_9ACTN|nr:hypothetical protein [Kribbella speibonae]TCC36028.1 hypothetical protein E0H92_25415 [Kribbella speibonae]